MKEFNIITAVQYSVALAVLAIGAGRLMGGDEVLVAFAAGMAFVQVITR